MSHLVSVQKSDVVVPAATQGRLILSGCSNNEFRNEALYAFTATL